MNRRKGLGFMQSDQSAQRFIACILAAGLFLSIQVAPGWGYIAFLTAIFLMVGARRDSASLAIALMVCATLVIGMFAIDIATVTSLLGIFAVAIWTMRPATAGEKRVVTGYDSEELRLLRRYQTALKEKDTEIKRLAYTAAHDLREPLRKVSSFSQILAEEYAPSELDERKRYYLDAISRGTKRMNELLTGLCNYASVESSLEETICCADTAILKAIDNLSDVVHEVNAQVAFQALPAVGANESHLVQVFQNLIGNAIKYRGDSLPFIEVDFSWVNDEWRFSVKDNGRGIKPSHRKRLFDLFYQIDTDIEGIGLGLAICHRIIRGYGGSIWLEETPNLGSTFCFTMPAASPAPLAA